MSVAIKLLHKSIYSHFIGQSFIRFLCEISTCCIHLLWRIVLPALGQWMTSSSCDKLGHVDIEDFNVIIIK